MGIYGITNNIIILEKKTTILGHIWISVAILNILFNLVAVPYLGIFGAGLVTLICYFFAFVVTVFYSKKYAPLPFDYKSIIKILIASAIMGIFVAFVNPTGIADILSVIAIAIAIYFAIIFLIKVIDKKEIDLLKGML